MGIEAIIGGIAAAVSLGTGIASAVSKPETPEQAKTGLSPGALKQQRQQHAYAKGSQGNILTPQKLGESGKPSIG